MEGKHLFPASQPRRLPHCAPLCFLLEHISAKNTCLCAKAVCSRCAASLQQHLLTGLLPTPRQDASSALRHPNDRESQWGPQGQPVSAPETSLRPSLTSPLLLSLVLDSPAGPLDVKHVSCKARRTPSCCFNRAASQETDLLNSARSVSHSKHEYIPAVLRAARRHRSSPWCVLKHALRASHAQLLLINIWERGHVKAFLNHFRLSFKVLTATVNPIVLRG